MRAIETIYQEMLAAYAERRGGQIEEDCELAVRLWAAAAQVQALEAQADWCWPRAFHKRRRENIWTAMPPCGV